MALPACPVGTLWGDAPAVIPGGSGLVSTQRLPLNFTRNAFVRVGAQFVPAPGQATASTWFAEWWMQSGRNPGVKEILLARIAGVHSTLVEIVRTFDAFAPLPTVNRPFDPNIDSFRIEYNSWKPVNDDGAQITVYFDACNTTTGGDCCAETLSKLDLILSYVSRTWPVVPSV